MAKTSPDPFEVHARSPKRHLKKGLDLKVRGDNAQKMMFMRKVDEIERQIQTLSEQEFLALRDWLLARDWSPWDATIQSYFSARRPLCDRR